MNSQKKYLFPIALCLTLFVLYQIKANQYNNLLYKYEKLFNNNLKEEPKLKAFIIRPMIFNYSNKIHLGEEYNADIRITVVDTSSPPTVILCNVDSITHDYQITKDTLFYNKKYECSTYNVKPKSIGIYRWSALVTHNYKNEQNRSIISGTFEVVK